MMAAVGSFWVTLLSGFFCLLPRSWAMAAGHAVAWVWFYLVPVRRKLALEQVARALGQNMPAAQRRRIVRASFTNLVLLAIEGLRYPLLTAQSSTELVRRSYFSRLDAHLARNKGVIAVSIHMGHFELLGTSQTVRGYPIHAVFKDMGHGALATFWRKQRRRLGLGEIAPRRSKEAIRAALGRNEVVAFLIDQHMAPYRSVVCTFMGRLAATTYAPVKFALETGAPIMPLMIVRDGFWGRHHITVLPEFLLQSPSEDSAYNLAHNTQRLNDLVEGWVRAYPEQWLWAHKRWKAEGRLQDYTVGAHLGLL